MSKKTEKLQRLIEREFEDERFLFTDKMLEAESRGFVSTLDELVQNEILVVALDARKQADSYWEASLSAREDGDPNNYCYVGTRVRFLRGTLQFEWFKNRTKPGEGEGKPRKVYSTYIPKGSGYRYSRALFKKEPEWAQEEINTVEDRYALLRKRSALLSAIKKNLREYNKVVNKCFPNNEEDN